MPKLSDLKIKLFDDKEVLKLRAIAKHAEALANELEAIDNAWQCKCGSAEYDDIELGSAGKIYYANRTCLQCGLIYAIPSDDDLPTRLEGSD